MTISVKYRYDAFISYSHKDQAWTRKKLLPNLEKNGVKVIIDFRDFEPAAPSLLEMERAVKGSRKTILVLTPNYLASAWSEFESILIGTLDPAAREKRILPILLQDCDIPLRISYLTYINFTDSASVEFQWRKVISAFSISPT